MVVIRISTCCRKLIYLKVLNGPLCGDCDRETETITVCIKEKDLKYFQYEV